MYSDIDKKTLGQMGEEFVADFLRKHGHIVIKRNYKNRYAEIDIIAEDKNNIVFVEVKTRTEGYMVSGIEAVDAAKRERLTNAANMLVSILKTPKTPRMDVAEVTVTVKEDGKIAYKLKYIKSAF